MPLSLLDFAGGLTDSSDGRVWITWKESRVQAWWDSKDEW